MRYLDLKNLDGGACLVRPQTVTSDLTALTGVDFRETDGPVSCKLEVGAVSGTTPTCDVKIQESVDNSVWTDVTGGAFGQKTSANASEWIQFNRTKRYLRGFVDVGGTTPSFAVSVTAVAQKKISGTGTGYQA